MTKKRWQPELLFPVADLVTGLLMASDHVTGVALTGSLARKEETIGDIDLLVFHDGKLPTGGCRDPEPELPRQGDILLAEAVGPGLMRRLQRAREDSSPVSYFFIPETALWNCEVLGSLRQHERFSDFYLTVLCQIPLYLISLPPSGALEQFTEGIEEEWLFSKHTDGPHYHGIPMRHRCGNPGCKPAKAWPKIKAEIEERKAGRGRRAETAILLGGNSRSYQDLVCS